jgi:hypothetical protein
MVETRSDISDTLTRQNPRSVTWECGESVYKPGLVAEASSYFAPINHVTGVCFFVPRSAESRLGVNIDFAIQLQLSPFHLKAILESCKVPCQGGLDIRIRSISRLLKSAPRVEAYVLPLFENTQLRVTLDSRLNTGISGLHGIQAGTQPSVI